MNHHVVETITPSSRQRNHSPSLEGFADGASDD